MLRVSVYVIIQPYILNFLSMDVIILFTNGIFALVSDILITVSIFIDYSGL